MIDVMVMVTIVWLYQLIFMDRDLMRPNSGNRMVSLFLHLFNRFNAFLSLTRRYKSENSLQFEIMFNICGRISLPFISVKSFMVSKAK